MSSLWTPSGEHPIDPSRPDQASPGQEGAREPDAGAAPKGAKAPGAGGSPGGAAPGAGGTTGVPPGGAPPSGGPGEGPAVSEEDAARLEELRRELASAPAEVVVANHCFGLFELAAVYLSQPEPRLDQARLAIDALGAVVEALTGRLGEAEAALKDAIAQLRLAYVQIDAAHRPPAADGGPAPGTAPG